MHREGMAQVVQTRLETPGVRPPDAGLVSDTPEAPLHGTLLQPGTRRRGEEGGLPRRAFRARRSILCQRSRQLAPQGDQPRLAELGLANGEHGLVGVHVGSVASQRRSPAP